MSILRKPPALRRGDRIAVLAPAAAVNDEALDQGIATLRAAGFEVVIGTHTRASHGYLAGTDEQRRADLRITLADPGIRAVVAARGGYGAGRLLTEECLFQPNDPLQIFAGHSDISFLLNDALQRAGRVTFHSPMVAGLREDSPTARALCAALTDADGWLGPHKAEQIRPGHASGLLAGGCLTIVASMLGTPYAVATEGRILFFEDANEKPFRIDRMLTQLWQAGAFDRVAGVVFGEMFGCTAGAGEAVTVRDVIAERFAAATFPVLYGVPSGHGPSTVVLPFGVQAEIAGGQLTILEPPFSA